MVYTLRFFSSSKCSLFHNSNVFGSCIIHILYTGCAKIKKKNNPVAKRLTATQTLKISLLRRVIWLVALVVSKDSRHKFHPVTGQEGRDGE